ncbi:hypothetical protein HA402_012999 [Bradysia odoriphaga]|nr:hypothetical protein HA402_012999 [Bradysia odoriphaga]
MNKVFILFVLAVAFVAHAHCHALKVESRLACGANERLNDCAPDRACDLTCANQNEQLFCMPSCEERCTCIDGFVRNAANACVARANC